MRRATWVPYGETFVAIYEGRVTISRTWSELTYERYKTAHQFINDLPRTMAPPDMTLRSIESVLEAWALEEGNHHGENSYAMMAAELLRDWQDEIDEAAALAEVDA
jgi:hypothetical protein